MYTLLQIIKLHSGQGHMKCNTDGNVVLPFLRDDVIFINEAYILIMYEVCLFTNIVYIKFGIIFQLRYYFQTLLFVVYIRRFIYKFFKCVSF